MRTLQPIKLIGLKDTIASFHEFHDFVSTTLEEFSIQLQVSGACQFFCQRVIRYWTRALGKYYYKMCPIISCSMLVF